MEGCLEVQEEVSLVGVPEAEGQQEDLGAHFGESQEGDLVVNLEVNVGIKALRFLAFQVVPRIDDPLALEQKEDW